MTTSIRLYFSDKVGQNMYKCTLIEQNEKTLILIYSLSFFHSVIEACLSLSTIGCVALASIWRVLYCLHTNSEFCGISGAFRGGLAFYSLISCIFHTYNQGIHSPSQ